MDLNADFGTAKMDTTKKCSLCEQILPVSDFYARNEYGNLRSQCKQCTGVTRYTDQIGNKMVYVVAYPISEDLAAVDQVINSSTIDSPTKS